MLVEALQLLRPVDAEREHVRGGGVGGTVTVVAYGDFLCPYCRRLVREMLRLRRALGDRLRYVFRHFPNERAHPGAERLARAAEAAGNQGRFWQLHDAFFAEEPPLGDAKVLELGRALGLDLARFAQDLEGDEARRRVHQDLEDGQHNGVTATPTIFIDGLRYDGAWDFYSLLEAIERPVAARVHRSARVFANLPASGGLVLLIAAAAALACANSPLSGLYRSFIESSFAVGPAGSALSLTVRDWFSEGLLTVFFLLVGLEIRRELTAGALVDRAAAVLPIVAAVGGVVVPAAVYRAFNSGATAPGWSIPTATDIAFTLGILAVLGARVPVSLRVFVAALAVVDDVLSVLTLAIFYRRSFQPLWLVAAAGALVGLFLLNRSRVYRVWPYALATAFLWTALHGAGVHAALAGVFLAALLPTQPAPAAGPLLAQAATALAALEHAESEAKQADADARVDQEPIWDWASRNLSAASQRLLSPADRMERVVAPWTAYLILPLFAFSATGVPLRLELDAPGDANVLIGIVCGLVVGKPLGVLAASWLAIKARIAVAPEGVTLRQFVGAGCLCGVADTVSLLMVDRAFSAPHTAEVAKIAVLAGSTLAAILGTLVLLRAPGAEPAGAQARGLA